MAWRGLTGHVALPAVPLGRNIGRHDGLADFGRAAFGTGQRAICKLRVIGCTIGEPALKAMVLVTKEIKMYHRTPNLYRQDAINNS